MITQANQTKDIHMNTISMVIKLKLLDIILLVKWKNIIYTNMM